MFDMYRIESMTVRNLISRRRVPRRFLGHGNDKKKVSTWDAFVWSEPPRFFFSEI